ncbi:hypothetical protein EDD27_7675 [Nonomuraea polychroma]|uniref:Uncharacterized protein n=1 Tax=Nonomuraea polychroma TaxID=46176 RepID=A0A438MH50_9ACTN|nr:hypothetical protein [Nonomuraea polychroma]RVX44908.1 hypothetical protein EDD27_7675 [Nonomuraea polychroma]
MSFTGVKLPEFDTLVARHTAAAMQIEELASLLYGELNGAGLDTAPAERIRKLAAQVGQEAEDLRKRQRIVREMERLKISIGPPVATGTLIAVPDSLPQAQGILDGAAAAKAAKAAAAGDKNALKQLQAYASKARDAGFVKAFLSQLGAKGVTEVPAAIAAQLRAAASAGNAGQTSKEAREAMRLLATALAKGTNPRDPAYMDDCFLNELVKHGRSEFKVNGVSYYGYQAQALIWRASEGKPPFSEKFMQVVGRDAIVFEKEKFQDRWKASKDAIGSALGSKQMPMADLATVLGVTQWMTPGTPSMGSAKQPVDESRKRLGSAVIDDLFHAAASDAKASQALLNHKPAGWKQSVLSYMLTDRLGAFQFHGNTDPFGQALRKALVGRDPVSLALTTEAVNTLKEQAKKVFAADSSGKLSITDRKLFDQLSFLRHPMGSALAAHIDQVYGTYETKSGGFLGPDKRQINKADMDRLLVLVSGDRDAATELQAAEAAHMLETINDSFKANGGKEVDSALRPEARVFGHLVEARRLALLANAWSDEQARKDAKDTINAAFAFLVGPTGQLGTKVAGEIGGQVAEKGAEIGFDKLAALAAERMIKLGVTSGEALNTANNQNEMIVWLMKSGITSAKIAAGDWPRAAMRAAENTRFVTGGHPPTIKPIQEIVADPVTFDQFMKWARRYTDIEEITSNLHDTMNTATDTVHGNLGINKY